jgi:hypothetical protein
LVSNDFYKTQNISVRKAIALKLLYILWTAGIGGTRNFNRKICHKFFTLAQVRFGIIFSDLFREFYIFSRSTEGFDMAGRSMNTSDKRRGYQRNDFLFPGRKSCCISIDG